MIGHTIDNSLTRGNKNEIMTWGMPDWSSGVDVSVPVEASPYVCDYDGVYVACFIPTQYPTYLYVNGVKTANCFNNSSSNNGNKSSISVFLKKGDSIYFTTAYNGSNLYSSAFYALKGD